MIVLLSLILALLLCLDHMEKPNRHRVIDAMAKADRKAPTMKRAAQWYEKSR